jgi:hypothetical protein
MRRRVSAAAVLATLGAAAPAWAESPADDWSGDYGKKAERRSDFVLGVSPGVVLGTASGYPNEIDKLHQPEWQVDSGFTGGFGFDAWLGGALTDWFTFGVGGAYYGGHGSGGTTRGAAFLIRVETFPLYGFGGPLRDLAVFANFGAGNLVLDPDDKTASKKSRADSGFASIGGGGVAYELFRTKHFAFAPSAEYLLFASEALHAHQVLMGVRVVYYGGPG